MRRGAGLAAWAALSLLAACGMDRSAGGGGFGGETISGRVVDGSGHPVAGASVRVRLARALDANVLAEASADDSGRFSLGGLPSAPLRIEIAGRVGAEAVGAVVDPDPQRPAADFVAHAASLRRLRIVDGAGKPVPATLQAYGLGSVASTDDSGVVQLRGWPASDLWVRISPRDGGAAFDLFVPASASGDVAASPGWLLDDFEGSSTRTRLGLLIGGGWWYAAASGALPDTSGSGIGQYVFGQGYDSTQSHGGRASLHAKFVFSPSATRRYALVGFHLGVVDGAPVDLSPMDSLVFWIKGDGPVRVDLVALESGAKRVYAKSATPGSDWTRIALVPTDFAPIDGGAGWAVASKGVLYLQFSVYGDTEFWLDDLRLFARRLP